MRFFLKQDTSEAGELFEVLDESGRTCFRLQGEAAAGGAVLYLLDSAGEQLARIRQFGLPSYRFSVISTSSGENATLLHSPAGGSALLKVSRKSWRLRGDITSRSFDIVEASGRVVMIHAKTWGEWGGGYEILLSDPQDASLCLSVAACVDFVAPGGEKTVVAIN